MDERYDWVIIGSGFGGSVSALRLAQKGYRVCVIEKGRRFAKEDFPETNWDLKRWAWMPKVGLTGFFQMSFFRHMTVVHGVGVGGGSLVYANTLPQPKKAFYQAGSWANLADWEQELSAHYATVKRMLGANTVPELTPGDRILKEMAQEMGRPESFSPTEVGVYFGAPGEEVADPYFEGEGPRRVGCTHCGACMTGCRVGAKNTLDRNYLYLAEKLGVKVEAEREVVFVGPAVGGGYRLETEGSLGAEKRDFHGARVIFAGGVLGTLPLLLKLRQQRSGLPKLSPRLGEAVRTNSEALLGVIAPEGDDFSKGVAITSILHTDEDSHIEPVRYAAGSGFFRLLALPHAPGKGPFSRLGRAAGLLAKSPLNWAKALTMKDFARNTQILLYMRSAPGSLTLELGRDVFTAFQEGLVSRLPESSEAPQAFMKEATELATTFAKKAGGLVAAMFTETLLGVPTTAHILGGCAMGETREEGVIDRDHQVFGYEGLYVIDGSAISANPGVNPSLTIAALAERAMDQIPAKA